MLENMLETGLNAALFKNEKIADQALFFLPSATALASGDRICLNYRSAKWPKCWMDVLCVTGGSCCSEELAGNKQNKKGGKNEEVQGQLLLIVIGNLDINSGQNI